MSDALRLFVGIDVGSDWTATLNSTADLLAETIQSGGRWVRPELYHVTVLFLGNQPPDAVPRITEALKTSSAAFESFPLRLREVVRFGRHEHGALVAAVDDPTGQLQRLRTRLDDELRRQGIDFDARGLVPHVTLVRPRRGSGPLPATPVDLRETPPLDVSELDLIRSDLLPTGPRYESIATARLGHAGSVG
jgi:RNA 2',3'-cyclic 3'-phosphodiesterase